MDNLVLVEWLDSFGCSSNWQSIEDLKPNPIVCRSVGWLIYDGDDCKVILPHITDSQKNIEKQGCGDMTIPSKCIIKIQNLVVKES